MPFNLRRAVDVVCALSVAGLIGGVLYLNKHGADERQAVTSVGAELQRFRQILDYHAATGSDTNARGWPTTIDPKWFGSDPPRNALAGPDRPWVEVATEDEAMLKDPEVRMTINPRLASFWYNPFQGILRARVPVAINDARALEMYNAINGTRLDSIYSPANPKAAKVMAETTAAPAPTASAEPVHTAPETGPPKFVPKH